MSERPHNNTGALITGGSQGLGLAIAKRLVEEGCARIDITSRNVENRATVFKPATSKLSPRTVSLDCGTVALRRMWSPP